MTRKCFFPVLLCCLVLAAASCGGTAPETTAGAGGSGGFRLRDGETFVFAGDSITDCGRRRGPLRGRRVTMNLLGDGYVSQVADLVRVRYPERTIKFINEGISGDTVVDLEERWGAVLAHKPDWLSVLVGINDLGSVLGKYGNVTPEIYEKKYRALLARAKQHCSPKLILIDPFYLSTARGTQTSQGVVLRELVAYRNIVAKLAKEFDAIHIKLHDVFQAHLKKHPRGVFCSEPVHPNASGHMVIAHEVLKALDW